MPTPSTSLENQENAEDEIEILRNQDATDSGGVNVDDKLMGAGPTNRFGPAKEPSDFVRGEVDVKTQMDRAAEHMQRHNWDLPESEN